MSLPTDRVVIGWDDEVTQGEGDADILTTGAERDRCLAAYLQQYPDGSHRAQDPDIVPFRIRLDWGRLSDYRTDSFGVNELALGGSRP